MHGAWYGIGMEHGYLHWLCIEIHGIGNSNGQQSFGVAVLVSSTIGGSGLTVLPALLSVCFVGSVQSSCLSIIYV